MKKQQLPGFLIVGAAKSGTTSLHNYLKDHPDVFLPESKELRFLSCMPGNYKGPGDKSVNESLLSDINEYSTKYQFKLNGQISGDISPDYLYFHKNTIASVESFFYEEPKIIIILRNPIDRAFSQYTHFLRDGREKKSFQDALLSCEQRSRDEWEWAWNYLDVGLYSEQVEAYQNRFKNVKVYLFDDLISDTKCLLHDLLDFLEVDSTYLPSNLTEKYNISGIPKSRLLHLFLHRQNIFKTFLKYLVPASLRHYAITRLNSKNLTKVKMREQDRNYLRAFYADDIKKLGGLISRDLSHWLE